MVNERSVALRWVPSAWLSMGLAYAVVTNTAAILLRDRGLSTSQAILCASLLGVPYVIKPLYAPLIELTRSKRFYIVFAELGLFIAFVLCTALAGLAGNAVAVLVAVFAVLAILGSVQDIACEGLFLTTLNRMRQAALTGVQSVAWNGAASIGVGALIAMSGWAGEHGWALALAGCALWYLVAAVWHRAVMPAGPRIEGVRERTSQVLLSFFHRAHFGPSMVLCLCIQVSAGLIEKVEPFFLIDLLGREALGGLYATAGFGALILGATLGSLLLVRHGLPRSMLLMSAAGMAPASLYFLLSLMPGVSRAVVVVGFLIARTVLAFAMVGYVVFLQRALASGPYPTTHYNLASGAKALVMLLTGMVSGPIQHSLGYRGVFAVALACGIPATFLCMRQRIARLTGD